MLLMAEQMHGQVLRGDRGDVHLWSLFVIPEFVVAAIVAEMILGQGFSLAHTLLLVAATIGGLIVAGLIGVGVVIVEEVQARRCRALDWQMGPVLRELMDVEQLNDRELTQWRRLQRRGITVEQARLWVGDGLAYPLLLASPRRPVEQRAVRALAGVMAEAGAWDGHDRRCLVDLIGFHIELTGGFYPVLGRWLAFPLDTVRERVAMAVAHAGADRYFIVAASRTAVAADAVLYELEDEHGIKGYRQQSYFYRSARSVHPSWLAHG